MLSFPQFEESWNEEEPLSRRTDCIDIAGSRFEYGDGRGAQARSGRAIDLSLAEAICGYEGIELRELRRLREENARLKKPVAGRDLKVDVMKEIRAGK